MRFVLIVALCIGASCQFFGTGAHIDTEGKKVSKKEGTADKITKGLEAADKAGLPFAGIAAMAWGVVATAGAWANRRAKIKAERQTADLEAEKEGIIDSTVSLIEAIKPQVKDMAGSKELKELIVKKTAGTWYGDLLRDGHARLKKI